MSVFNAILKSTKACIVTIIVYFSVFVLFGNISARATASTKDTMFEDSVVTVAITDNDNSALSRGLVDYLKETENVVDPQTTSIKEMNDNVRFLIYDYALIIPEDFSERAKAGETEDLLEYVAPGATAPQFLLTEKIRTYMQDVMVYLNSGYSDEEAIALTKENMIKLSETKANVIDTADENHRSFYTGMFTFNGYTLLMILCVSISSVLGFTKDTDVKNRINVSGMHFNTKNAATIAAVFCIGIVITAAITVVVGLMGLSDTNGKFLFYCINVFALMLIGIGMAYMISAITNNENIINMVTNMFVLSMSFFCGVFIDLQFLSPAIVKFAHFLPLYWYTAVIRLINDTPADKILGTTFYEYLLIEVLFAGIFFAAGLVISKKKEQYAV
ncbi:ABC-2 type transport system permease protein [Pseudobutyrivibrio sp. OR37]|uniref:ABC transporter permease n=1 Tax=Pseudobutyrivibrio sp. OR37 TaxID=1798186 RepID=UPI0008E04E30|nr:ABC transporter permease [Pseudobutyrivibrio sp. OR37]SFI02600.1 ABC-2 type transport system permease protein [Pseudobutyrivibrio sp. OR37]